MKVRLPGIALLVLAGLVNARAAGFDCKAAATPICLLPADASEDMREANASYGTGHYTIEVIPDVPVLVAGQCYIGRLRDWFGGYTPKSGLDAEICIRKPEDASPSEEECYTAGGPRTVVGIAAGAGPFPH